MPKITIYQKPTCTTCRKVHAALKDSGVNFQIFYSDGTGQGNAPFLK